MSEQSCSVVALIATTMLSSHKVLNVIRHIPFSKQLGKEDLREAVYLGYQPWAARQPDHVFESSWQHLAQHIGNRVPSSWLPGALQALANEFLESRHGELSVKRCKFSAWQQSVLSRICGLPVLAAARGLERGRAYFPAPSTHSPSADAGIAQTSWAPKMMPLLRPYDALVEDYITREGLHETHLHLNGSTHAELCWLRALHAPKAETQDFNNKWITKNSREAARMRELALAINPAHSPVELYHQLVAAGNLRQWLIAAATDSILLKAPLPFDYDVLVTSTHGQNAAPLPAERRLQLSAQSCANDEIYWIRLLLKRLECTPSITLERMLHCYLLLQNQYYRLLVQSEEQFGFDQFQKVTFTELREPAEKDFLNRFLTMHGKHVSFSRTGYLEGRFAPKATLEKNHQLLYSILGAYWRYLGKDQQQRSQHQTLFSSRVPPMSVLLEDLEKHFQKKSPLDRAHHRLALVAHFIKKPWSASPAHQAGPYRFFRQRAELKKSTNVLLQTLAKWPRLHTWLRGIDAAANELDAPPEVFASCYRVCEHAGLTRRSYHVGEDFPHLLTGMRYMLDALELLDLHDGDRIGHGTAMGISPQLWLERMPGQLIVKKGEWMLDLLAAWRLLRELPEATVVASRIACNLAACASYVYGRDISCAALERAMSFRHLNPHYLGESREALWQWNHVSLNDSWQAEAKRVHEALSNNREDLDLLWEWLSDRSLWARSEELNNVDAAYFNAATYVQIQQGLMAKVAERGVVIETLPSSNVRISQYHSFSEHHALRWMRVPGFVQEGDPEIMVSLGSDDPGIFACDLTTDFYQLYAALQNQGLGDKAALNYLAPLNERGRKYRFHDPSIG